MRIRIRHIQRHTQQRIRPKVRTHTPIPITTQTKILVLHRTGITTGIRIPQLQVLRTTHTQILHSNTITTTQRSIKIRRVITHSISSISTNIRTIRSIHINRSTTTLGNGNRLPKHQHVQVTSIVITEQGTTITYHKRLGKYIKKRSTERFFMYCMNIERGRDTIDKYIV